MPRLKDVIQGVMELLKDEANDEGIDLLTLDFRDAFKQLHVVKSQRPFLAGVAMGGFSPTELCYLALDQVLWSGVGSQHGLCAARKHGWPTNVPKPIASWTTPSSC